MEKNNQIRTCLYSGERFIPTRNNQKFSSMKHRVLFHNQNNNSLRKRLSSINKQLLLNFRVLIDVLDGYDEAVVHQEYLKGKNFSFSVFTHLTKSRISNNYCYSVYEVAFERLDEDNYKITRL